MDEQLCAYEPEEVGDQVLAYLRYRILRLVWVYFDGRHLVRVLSLLDIFEIFLFVLFLCVRTPVIALPYVMQARNALSLSPCSLWRIFDQI